jgi:hypothetical protein
MSFPGLAFALLEALRELQKNACNSETTMS